MAVICLQCGSENRDDQRTCESCKTSLPPVVEGLEPLGGAPPPEPEVPPADPEVGSLGSPKVPERAPSGLRVGQARRSARKGRSAAVTGGIVGALIGGGGMAFIVTCVWLASRQARIPETDWVFLAVLLEAATAAAMGGAIIGAVAGHAGGGAATGAKVGAVLAGFGALLWLTHLVLRAGSMGPLATEFWRALVVTGLGVAFGGVIGAAVQAATDRWS